MHFALLDPACDFKLSLDHAIPTASRNGEPPAVRKVSRHHWLPIQPLACCYGTFENREQRRSASTRRDRGRSYHRPSNDDLGLMAIGPADEKE